MSPVIDGVPARFPEAPIESPASDSRRGDPPPPERDLSPTPFERLLRGLGSTIERGERIVARAAGGYAKLDAAELIALQAGIYRYSEAVDLVAKLVDRGTGAVRTVLQGGH
jgi:hypothetical protein